MNTQALGKHLLIEYYGCALEVINREDRIREAMLDAAKRANATIVADVFHRFNPHGISGVVVIAESHVAIHTWPEHRCASVDVFSCSDKMNISVIESYLKDVFRAERSVSTEFDRGLVSTAAEKHLPDFSLTT